jgi:hypothetical protein
MLSKDYQYTRTAVSLRRDFLAELHEFCNQHDITLSCLFRLALRKILKEGFVIPQKQGDDKDERERLLVRSSE